MYLGLDSSTQSLKALVIAPESGEIAASETVNFTEDLPEFKCPSGVLDNPDPLVKHSDPLMWAAALDLVLDRLRKSRAPLSEIKGISGSGQQHGSVYLNATSADILSHLDPNASLADQLAPTLSRPSSPIWMDSSTSIECAEIAATIGERLQTDTGSPAVERFTGPQIRKFWKESPDAYAETAVIHLVSSFMCSLLIGENAPIDHGDGAGMNLLNLKTLQWDPVICEATAPGLEDKLPPVVKSSALAGELSPYFEKHGLPAGIPVVAWSGDNPNSLIGTGAWRSGVAVISLGTSDTLFAAMDSVKVDPDGYGHVFGSPAGGFMSLICFKNGSLAREKVKDQLGVDWDYFGATAFEETSPGNDGDLMLPYFAPEITPLTLKPSNRRIGSESFVAGDAGPAKEIRAIVEAQALAMRAHSRWIGDFTTLRVTGGASRSLGLCQTLANVFQATLEKIAVADSAGLGAAIRAANAVGDHSWEDLTAKFAETVETVEPDSNTGEVYQQALECYAELEQSETSS